MSNPAGIYRITFITACVFLVVEAVYSTMDEMKRSQKTTLSQATSWIRSILMVVLAVIMFLFLGSTVTSTSYSGGGY